MMECTQSKNILKNYFNNIVYIDDEFDTSLVDEHTKGDTNDVMQSPPMDIPNVSDPIVENVGVYPESVEENFAESMQPNSSYIQLSELLIKLNEEPYQDIQLTPILYKDKIEEELVIKNMIKSPLSIIDWELSTKIKAFSLIKRMSENTEQLKVVVVYTRSYGEAYSSLSTEFNEGEYIELYNSPEKSLTIVQVKNKSLVIIAGKQFYNVLQLQEIITEKFISLYGIIPVALLDLTQRINEKSGRIFGSFCHPLDQLYFLQMYYSGVDTSEMKETLSGFIINKIKTDIELSDNFMDDVLNDVKNRFNELLSNKGFDDTKNIKADLLASKLPEKYKCYCEVIKQIDEKQFKSCLENLLKEDVDTWEKVVKCFDEIILEIKNTIVEKEYQDTFTQSELDEREQFEKTFKNHTIKIKKMIREAELENYKNFKKEIWPLYIQLLISSDELLESSASLISNLKYHKYSDNKMDGFLVFDDTISEDARSKELFNKLHFGDVFENKEKNEFMLCITPSCDTYRPLKTRFKINCIKGKIIGEKELHKEQKSSHHVSAYPLKGEDGCERAIYIEWHFYEQISYNLFEKNDCDTLRKYNRNYRMDEIYMRQIANEYISYYSRAGVDELFLKERNSLAGLFN